MVDYKQIMTEKTMREKFDERHVTKHEDDEFFEYHGENI